jgi:hypothetical protein
MNWVKEKFDLILLALATLLLASNAGWIAMNRVEQVADPGCAFTFQGQLDHPAES